MTSTPSNPFVLPGFGQSGDFATNPVMASMEMMRQAWQSLAAHGGVGAPSVAATLSAQELEQRITDLRAVENWLRMNLTVLSSTIQGLEVQRATLSTLKSFAHNAAAATGQETSFLETLFGLKPVQSAHAKPAGETPVFDMAQATEATQAWWDLLRKQFDTLAAATAASMQAPPASEPTAGATRTRRKTTTAKPKATSQATKARSAKR